jgi:glycerol uptake facilitator-like aquaporin
MDGYTSEKRTTFMLYEALGTMIFAYAVNIGAGAGPYGLMFAALFVGNRTCGHFNLGVTLGSFIYNIANWKSNIESVICIVVSQILGGAAAIALSYLNTK